jgi:hypothetical protein
MTYLDCCVAVAAIRHFDFGIRPAKKSAQVLANDRRS